MFKRRTENIGIYEPRVLSQYEFFGEYMDSKQTYYVGGRQKSNSVDIIKHEKVNRKTRKVGKIKNRKCLFYGRSKPRSFTR